MRIYLAHAAGAQGDVVLLDGEAARRRAAMRPKRPTVYLAAEGGMAGAYANNLMGERGVRKLAEHEYPSLLFSYVYVHDFLAQQKRYAYRDWALDSGAFTARASGKPIELAAYTDFCLELQDKDETLVEIFALDVIGDWRAGLRNTEFMWKRGVQAIPCYHIGEPEDLLTGLAKDYPKIALGGVADMRGSKRKLEWASQCFARVWPKKIHGFAVAQDDLVMALPWHSVDASSWESGPCRWGNWRTYGKLSWRGSEQDLAVEIRHYLELERKARAFWKKQMALLESLDAA